MVNKKNKKTKEKKGGSYSYIRESLEKIHNLTLAQKMSDSISSVIGSWEFIIIQSVLLAIWATLNLTAWVFHWDPYPFIFLNLLLSIQAAFSGPIILMSQNRAAERDRRKAEIDLATDRKAEREIEEIQATLKKLEKNKIDKILKIIENNTN